MTYVPIAPSEIASGEPVSSTVATKIKNNFQNHEDRITAAENGNLTVYQPIMFSVYGSYSPKAGASEVLVTTANFNLTITGVFLIIKTAGSSGTTEIDLKYKRGSNPWQSVFSTKPSLAHSAGNYARSTNGVLDPTYVEIEAGDLIAIDLPQAQVNANTFFVRVDFVKT